MVAVKLYFLFLLVTLCKSKRSLVPQAISQLVQSHFSESSETVQVYYNSERLEILDETLKLLRDEQEVKVTKLGAEIENSENFTYNYKNAIFLVDTMDNYNDYVVSAFQYGKLRDWIYLSLVIYCEGLTRSKVETMITQYSFNTFLIEENEEISLHAMTMYTEKQCDVPQLIQINRFSAQQRKWSTDNYFSLKIENCHGCIINIEFFFQRKGISKVTFSEDGKLIIADGALIEMMKTLSTHLNFTINYPYVYRNDTWIIAIVPLVTVTYDDAFFISDPVYYESDIFVVPSGEPYMPWEKLLLPFDNMTWMWLGTAFTIGFVVILLIRVSRSHSAHEFVIGSNVTTPTLNIVAIFMGIGQGVLPPRNVSRIFLICFIWFSLIMRTAYQGKYFEFITSNVIKKPVATIEEAFDKNFTFYNDATIDNTLTFYDDYRHIKR